MHTTRRRLLAVALVVLVSAVASSCSVLEVQTWFAIRGNPSVSAQDARTIADAVNKDAPGGCDTNYGGCVPNNQAVVHCLGDAGEGVSVTGPVAVIGWDHFRLDPDGDKVACPDRLPIGSFDLAVQKGFEIVASGWALDPETNDPIQVHLYDNGVGTAYEASRPRPDLAGFGKGAAHAFREHWIVDPGVHEVCAYAINAQGGPTSTGNTLLGCKSVQIIPVWTGVWGDAQAATLIEEARFVSAPYGNGTAVRLHVSGFFFDSLGPGFSLDAQIHAVDMRPGPGLGTWVNLGSVVTGSPRPDVEAYYPDAGPSTGFGYNIDTTPDESHSTICVALRRTEQPYYWINVSCREVGS